jgi:hypothetical protein
VRINTMLGVSNCAVATHGNHDTHSNPKRNCFLIRLFLTMIGTHIYKITV